MLCDGRGAKRSLRRLIGDGGTGVPSYENEQHPGLAEHSALIWSGQGADSTRASGGKYGGLRGKLKGARLTTRVSNGRTSGKSSIRTLPTNWRI